MSRDPDEARQGDLYSWIPALEAKVEQCDVVQLGKYSISSIEDDLEEMGPESQRFHKVLMKFRLESGVNPLFEPSHATLSMNGGTFLAHVNRKSRQHCKEAGYPSPYGEAMQQDDESHLFLDTPNSNSEFDTLSVAQVYSSALSTQSGGMDSRACAEPIKSVSESCHFWGIRDVLGVEQEQARWKLAQELLRRPPIPVAPLPPPPLPPAAKGVSNIEKRGSIAQPLPPPPPRSLPPSSSSANGKPPLPNKTKGGPPPPPPVHPAKAASSAKSRDRRLSPERGPAAESSGSKGPVTVGIAPSLQTRISPPRRPSDSRERSTRGSGSSAPASSSRSHQSNGNSRNSRSRSRSRERSYSPYSNRDNRDRGRYNDGSSHSSRSHYSSSTRGRSSSRDREKSDNNSSNRSYRDRDRRNDGRSR